MLYVLTCTLHVLICCVYSPLYLVYHTLIIMIQQYYNNKDELVSERERIDEEERRKELVRYSLSEIFPWETRDSEMEILVDECKEVILGLSSKDETFVGPFILAGGLPAVSGGEDEGNGDNNDDDQEEGITEDQKATKDLAAAQSSAEKLEKLQPLPTLLADFDLDTHVGLIQRLLKEDPNLVDMHTRLSSGGQRELIFWKNYFFHCAYTRYEAGLSIDEIWSNEPRPSSQAVAAVEEESEDLTDVDADSEEVIFDSDEAMEPMKGESAILGRDSSSSTNDAQSSAASTVTSTSIGGGVDSPPSSPQRETAQADIATPSDSVAESGGGNDYEFVPSAGGGDDDGEMDELEAEIAAALDD